MSANTNPGAPSETPEKQEYGPGGRARLNKASPLGLIHRVVEEADLGHIVLRVGTPRHMRTGKVASSGAPG